MLKKPTPTEERFSHFTPQENVTAYRRYDSIINTFISAAAALRLMTATDSRLRRRGSRLRAERELEKEQSEAVPGVTGVCGTLKPSTSSTVRKARPRDRGSTIYRQTHTHTQTQRHTKTVCQHCFKLQAAEQGKARGQHTKSSAKTGQLLHSSCRSAIFYDVIQPASAATFSPFRQDAVFFSDLGTSWQATATDAMKVVLPSAFHSTFAQVLSVAITRSLYT